jgi:peroxiredoxin
MRQWGLHQGLPEDKSVGSLGFQNVKLIPDGAAAFTRAMGMSTMWDVERGFGERSWRYSMVVNDGVIEAMFIEQPQIQNSKADPFEVSDAETYVISSREKVFRVSSLKSLVWTHTVLFFVSFLFTV